MKAATNKRPERWAAIPFRALGDKRLSRADLAVLGVIAAHDRFQANGRGCDAGRPRIAHLANCDMATMSHAVSRLESFGYVGSRAHPADGRKRIYWVIYTDDDAKFLSGETNPTPRGGTAGRGDIGGRPATETPEIGGAGKGLSVDSAREILTNIFPEREKIFGEPENRYATTRALQGKKETWRSLSSHVCEIERRFKRGEISCPEALADLSDLYFQADDAQETAQIERVIGEIEDAGSR
jgi:DNA-binding MarR family transcriptional regulator